MVSASTTLLSSSSFLLYLLFSFWFSTIRCVIVGYGGAIAAVALMILRTSHPNLPYHAYIHSMLHAIYGVRLCLFLLVRETFIPYFRQLRERIEKNSPPSRLQRTPFIVSCGFLYAFMSCPLLITAAMPAFEVGSKLYKTMSVLLGIAGSGLALQIIGDTQKSIGKLRGEELITTGLSFRFYLFYTSSTHLFI